MVTLNLTDQEAEYIIKLLLSDKVDNVTAGTDTFDATYNAIYSAIIPQTLSNTVEYLGVVSSEKLFSGLDLASHIGLHCGTHVNSNAGWLKFRDHGKIKYIARKPFISSITYENINAVGAVRGITIPFYDKAVIVRLPTGGVNYKDKVNEWDRLMTPLIHNFTETYLGNDEKYGSWTQMNPNDRSYSCIQRGGGGRLARWTNPFPAYVNPLHGNQLGCWRPLLELV